MFLPVFPCSVQQNTRRCTHTSAYAVHICTHAHTCTHVHTVKPSPCAAASHCPPLSASPQAPGRAPQLCPGFLHHTFPFSTTSHTTSAVKEWFLLKSECLLLSDSRWLWPWGQVGGVSLGHPSSDLSIGGLHPLGDAP